MYIHVSPQLFKLQHDGNHDIKRDADTNNNRVSLGKSNDICHTNCKSCVETQDLRVINYFRGGLYLKF
jgi:hypothetical protein